MYQVIARKWRPQRFEEVTGQEPITRTLTNAIAHERLHHAYLFSGARGVGKTTTARLLAKSLNCHKSDKPTSEPCAVTDPTACASCREVAEGRSIDVLEIDAASNTGVDNVRESIINTVGIRPARDRYKVFIIDEVHMLSGAAFNALLKTLEEPPSRVTFIMATTEAHKLPDTILSRCQQFEFRTIPVPKITDRLRRIADAEGVNITDDALREIARAGEGSMRDAQSAFDQVISFSGESIKPEDVEAALGLAGTELLRRTVRAVADQQPAEIISVVDDLVMRGHDLRNFTRDLLAYIRDLLITRINAGNTPHANRGDGATVDAGEAELSARFSEADLVRFFHSLTATERDLRESAHPRYQLEVGLVKLVEMGRLANLEDVLKRLGELETRLRGDGGASSASGSSGGASLPPAVGGTGSGSTGVAPRRAGNGSGISGNNAPRPSFAAPSTPQQPLATSPGSSLATPPLPSSAVATPRAVQDVASAPPNAMAGLKLVTTPAPVVNGAAKEQVGRATGADLDEPPFDFSSAPDDMFAETSTAPDIPAASSLVERIKIELENQRRAFVAITLEEAHRVALEGDDLCVDFSPKTKHLRDNLTRPENIKALREACRAVTGRDLGLRINVRDPQELNDASNASNANAHFNERAQARQQADDERAELWRIAEAHPTIQSFKRIFRGEIVSVWRKPVEDATDT